MSNMSFTYIITILWVLRQVRKMKYDFHLTLQLERNSKCWTVRERGYMASYPVRRIKIDNETLAFSLFFIFGVVAPLSNSNHDCFLRIWTSLITWLAVFTKSSAGRFPVCSCTKHGCYKLCICKLDMIADF